MTEPPAEGPLPDSPARRRLDSWKEIAAYLDRGVTTVQRWEQHDGMPAHRLPHAKKGSVFAYTDELDAWRLTRRDVAESVDRAANDTARGPGGRGRAVALTLLAGAVIVAALFTLGVVTRSPTAPAPAVTAPIDEGVVIAAEPENERGPSLSPDGQWVAYAWNRASSPGLYRKRVPSGAPELLLPDTNGRSVALARWSPDGGSIIAVISEGNDRYAVEVIPAAGGRPDRLTAMAGLGACWSPDSQSVGFVDRTSPTEPFSVFVLDRASRTRRRLTAPPAGTFGDTACSFAPNGKELAVTRFPTRYEADIIVVDAASGSRLRQLTHRSEGIDDLAWSPDGSTIVYGTFAGLWKVSPTGNGDVSRVTPEGPGAGRPQWSGLLPGQPASLAYQRELRTRRIVVWSGSHAGGERVLLPPTAASNVFPSVSRDGRRIVLESLGELWTAQADGTGLRQLSLPSIAGRTGPITGPRWSPDGSSIAFSATLHGQRDVFVATEDGTKVRRFTDDPSAEDNASWSRDGRWIYFRSNRDGLNGIWRQAIDGGEAIRVTAGEASQALESPDGSILYFVRGTMQPGLWAMPARGGAERLVLSDVFEHFWDVADNGILFVSNSAGVSGNPALELFRFEDRARHRLATLGRVPVPGFAVTRDGGSAFWSRAVVGYDVMLTRP